MKFIQHHVAYPPFVLTFSHIFEGHPYQSRQEARCLEETHNGWVCYLFAAPASQADTRKLWLKSGPCLGAQSGGQHRMEVQEGDSDVLVDRLGGQQGCLLERRTQRGPLTFGNLG